MKKNNLIVLLCFCLCTSFGLFSQEATKNYSALERMNIVQNEMRMVDDLINCAQKTIDNLKTIKKQMEQYEATQKKFINDPNNKELILGTVKSARTLLESIQEANLTQNFDPEFISELTLLSQIGSKKSK